MTERWTASTSTSARSSGRSTTSVSPASARRRWPSRPSSTGPRPAGEITLIRSPAHLVENDANPREDRRLAAALWIDGAGVDVPLHAGVEARAGELAALGFGALDALHLAFAERAEAAWFVTKLLRLAGRLGDALRTSVVAPPALARRSAQ